MAMRRFFFSVGLIVAIAFSAVPLVAHADTLGQSVTFFVNSDYDAQSASSATATLRAMGAHGYFYVDDRYWATLSSLQRSQFQINVDALDQEFDATIWPRSTAFWGLPAVGISGDPHITVLLEELKQGNGGYFESKNHYSQRLLANSNEREMVFVSADSALGSGAKSFLAHEFQHLISFNQKELLQRISDDTWLNESRSEYNIDVVGYAVPFAGSTLERRAQSFTRTPSDSLTEWPNTSTDYAIASVFTHYLVGQVGDTILQSTIHLPLAGVEALQSWLTMNVPGTSFGDVFTDWMVASSLNDRSSDPHYGYALTGLSTLHVPAQYAVSVGSSGTVSWTSALKEWQPTWLEFDMPAYAVPPTLSLGIAGATTVPWSGAYIADYGGTKRVVPWSAPTGTLALAIPSQSDSSPLRSVVLMLTQGQIIAIDDRAIVAQPVTVTATFGTLPTVTAPSSPAIPTPLPVPLALHDGDLIRHNGQLEIYVIWGPYRRYLTTSILALYGFQNRPVISVDDNTFARYQTSNYIRAVDQQRVYAIWPDGSKHWLHITAAQWDASGRDWNAIFIVNDAEVNAYRVGADITQ